MKNKSEFQKQCEAYMKGEMDYLGIYKDKTTGYVHARPTAQRQNLFIRFINRILGK